MNDDKKIDQIEKEIARMQAGKDSSAMLLKAIKLVLTELKAVKRQNAIILQALKSHPEKTYVVSFDLHMPGEDVRRVKSVAFKTNDPSGVLELVKGWQHFTRFDWECDNYSVEEVDGETLV